MKSDVDVVRGSDQFVRQSRPAAWAEHSPVWAEGREDTFSPPTPVAKLHDVAADGVELGKDAVQSRAWIVEAGWKLEKETTHSRPEQIGDVAEVLYQCLRAAEAFDVGNQFRRFNRVDELSTSCLPNPSLNCGGRWPGVERGVKLDRFEMLGVVLEPSVRG